MKALKGEVENWNSRCKCQIYLTLHVGNLLRMEDIFNSAFHFNWQNVTIIWRRTLSLWEYNTIFNNIQHVENNNKERCTKIQMIFILFSIVWLFSINVWLQSMIKLLWSSWYFILMIISSIISLILKYIGLREMQMN